MLFVDCSVYVVSYDIIRQSEAANTNGALCGHYCILAEDFNTTIITKPSTNCWLLYFPPNSDTFYVNISSEL